MSLFSLAKATGKWFLVFFCLYGIYAATAFVRLGEQFQSSDRLLMVLGPSTLAWAILLSLATFAGSTASFDLSSANARGIRCAYWSQIASFGLVSYSLAAVGPSVVLSMMPEVVAQLRSTPGAGGALQPLFPVTFGLFSVVSGLAGTLLGWISSRSTWTYVGAAKWLVCLGLVGTFLLSLLGTTTLIRRYDLPSALIMVLPLALPLAVTVALAWRDLGDGGRRNFIASRRSKCHPVDPDALDEIVSKINAAHLSDDSIHGVSATGTDDELRQLVAGIRAIAGPRARMSPQRAAEIVNLGLNQQASRQSPVSASMSLNLGTLIEFSCAWVSLATGVTLVGLIGGVSPSLLPATIVGFVGAAVLAPGVRNKVGPLSSESARA